MMISESASASEWPSCCNGCVHFGADGCTKHPRHYIEAKKRSGEPCPDFAEQLVAQEGICSVKLSNTVRLIIERKDGKWVYSVGTLHYGKLDRGIEHPSHSAPWEENRGLWTKLERELKSVGIQNPNNSLKEAGKLLREQGGEELFKREKEETKKKVKAISPEVRQKALEILERGDQIKFVGDTIQLMHKGDYELGLYLWLGTLTPELGYRLHALAVGSSGVGKSDLTRKVCRCVPASKRIKLDSASPKSLYYAVKAGVDVDGAIFNIDDVNPDDPEQIKLLKLMATDDPDELRHWTLTDNRDFAELVCSRRFVVFASTIESLTSKQGQILRRYEVLNPSEDEEELKKTMDHIKSEVRQGKSEENYPIEFEVAQTITDEIKKQKFKVAIPFDFEFPQQGFEAKTALKKFAALIWAITKARFKQRIAIGDTLLAQLEDFDLARELWGKRQPFKIDETATRVLVELDDQEPIEKYDSYENLQYWNPEPQTSTTLARKLKLAPRTVQDKLIHLYSAGLVDRKQVRGRGNPYAYWKAPVVSEKIGDLLEKGETISHYTAVRKILPSLDLNKLVSSVDDFMRNFRYDKTGDTYTELWREYKDRLSHYVSLLSAGGNNTNNQPNKESIPIEQSETKENAPRLNGEKKSSFSNTNKIPNITELPQAELIKRLGNLHRKVGGDGLTPDGFLTMAKAHIDEPEVRLRAAIQELAKRGALFRLSEGEK